MLVFRNAARMGRRLRRPVLTLGNFDGVHRGHQEILHRVATVAQERDAHAVALTFEPHPAAILSPNKVPLQITDWRTRVERMGGCGIDAVVVQRFTRAFSEMTAEEFVERLLVHDLGVSAVVVGHRVSFGYRRGGDAETLYRLGAKHGFAVEVIGPVRVAGFEVSSSAIRSVIAAGDLAQATVLLGFDPSVRGRVVRGDQRGAALGFPTANLRVDTWVIPPDGVYAVEAIVDGRTHAAVANLGTRPTFGVGGRVLEVHLLDWRGDLYGKRIEARFKCHLRGEMRFAGVGELVAQIGRDVGAARAILTQAAK